MPQDLDEYRRRVRRETESAQEGATLELPDATEHVVWVCPRPLRDNNSRTMFQAGDELPVDVYERVLPAFDDRVAFVDEHGERIDSENDFETRGALSEWRDEAFENSED